MVLTSEVLNLKNWRVTKKSAASLPQSTSSALFTISGGAVEVRNVIGQVMTSIQNQANNTKLIANPSGGTSTDMCTVLDIDNDQSGEMYALNGTANALTNVTSQGTIDIPEVGYFIPSGTIDLDCAASSTGSIIWYCIWRPLDSGATITSA